MMKFCHKFGYVKLVKGSSVKLSTCSYHLPASQSLLSCLLAYVKHCLFCFCFNGSSHLIAYKKTSAESIPKIVWFTFFSSYAKQFCFPSAHVSALALKCSIMFKCHKLKKLKHLPALECKMRETLNWQSQIILFFFFFLQITITLLYDSNTNSLRLFIAHCNISAYSLRPRVQLYAQNHLSVGRSSSKRHTDIKW